MNDKKDRNWSGWSRADYRRMRREEKNRWLASIRRNQR